MDNIETLPFNGSMDGDALFAESQDYISYNIIYYDTYIRM